MKAVDSQITSHYALIRERLFQEAKRERIEYEKFYSSLSGVLREKFLRSRKKVDGHYLCEVCKQAIWWERDVTLDHIKPRSKFPALAMDINNLRIVCRSCNSSKGDRIVIIEATVGGHAVETEADIPHKVEQQGDGRVGYANTNHRNSGY